MPLTIVTSLPPRTKRITKLRGDVGDEYTHACMDAWIEAGAQVVSVNPADEAEAIKSAFPSVRVHPVHTDARLEFGRPLVYISDMLAAARSSSTDAAAIVNADILYTGQDIQLEKLAEIASMGFAYANRFEVDEPDSASGEMYNYGFDLFAFPVSLASTFSMRGFAMGVPWWDYWLPAQVLVSDTPIFQLRTDLFRHLTHPTHWDHQLWQAGLRSVVSHLSNLPGNETLAASRGNADQFLAALGRFILRSIDPEGVPPHGMRRASAEAVGVGLGVFMVEELGRRSTIVPL